MITHVAEAAEARGRVVLRLTPGACGGRVALAAIDAAVRLARAYNAEIESLYIEDTELLRLASFGFAMEIPAQGRRLGGVRRPLSVADIERDMRLQFSGVQRLVEQRAALADVTVHLRVVRDEPVHAVATTCAACGPWNVVVLAEPLASLQAGQLADLFAGVPDTTGLMVAGLEQGLASASNNRPVVLALEDADALPAMLHTAERLVEGTEASAESSIVVLLVESDSGGDFAPDMGQSLESQVRLALSERPPMSRADGTTVTVQIIALTETHGDAAVIAEALRRLAPGFLIARFGGLIVPPDCSLRLLGTTLQCPLLLIR
jgi:hypothetical protein